MTVYNTRKRISEEDSEAPIQNIEFNNDVEGTATIQELDLYENDSNNNTTIREELLEFPIANENQAGFMSPTSYQDIEDIKIEIETLFNFKISKPYNSLDDIINPQEKIIYMVKNNTSYDLYLWFLDKENHFQKIGNTSLDMSNFLTTEDGASLYQSIQRRELLSNKKTTFENSNNTTYPTTLATKTELDKKELLENKKTTFENSNNTTYPTTLATKTELDKKELLENKKTTFEDSNNTTYPTTLATKTELDKKELLENKKTTFTNANDTTYPTTRLVKSSLDTLQKQAVEIFIGDSEPSLDEGDGLKLWINDSDGGDVFGVIDNLEYDNPTTGKSLSAHQGYILNNKKQDKLIGEGIGQNIKTINNNNILGSGNITIQGGGGSAIGVLPQLTYTDLQAIIDDATNGSTVYLNGYFKPDDINDYIDVNKPLTIIGKSCVINGGRGILIKSNDVTIKNIDFVECSSNAGSAIYSLANITIKNCSFINNSAGDEGGAIFCEGNLTIKDSSFVNNSTSINGGAINSYGDELTVENCSFVNNSADYGDGGAIFWNGSNDNVSDCVFKTATDTVFGITPTYTSLNNKKDGEIVTKDNLKNKSTLTFVLSDGTTETHTFYEEV